MKEILKRKLEHWDIDCSFILLGWVFVALVIFTLIRLIYSDRAIRCYYPFYAATSAGIAYQIKADINWADDLLVFSSPDLKVAMEVYNQLPKCGGRK